MSEPDLSLSTVLFIYILINKSSQSTTSENLVFVAISMRKCFGLCFLYSVCEYANVC